MPGTCFVRIHDAVFLREYHNKTRPPLTKSTADTWAFRSICATVLSHWGRTIYDLHSSFNRTQRIRSNRTIDTTTIFSFTMTNGPTASFFKEARLLRSYGPWGKHKGSYKRSGGRSEGGIQTAAIKTMHLLYPLRNNKYK